jgi:hypothetical protein
MVCAQNLAGRLDIAPAEGLAEALLEGAMNDFTDADLSHARRPSAIRGLFRSRGTA